MAGRVRDHLSEAWVQDPPGQRKLATDFMAKLQDRGYSVRCFDPAGQDDIGGGCGQLWFVQDWMQKHPTLARPSVGRTFPIIHAPRLAA